MTRAIPPAPDVEDMAATYERDGFVVSIEAVSATEARELRDDLGRARFAGRRWAIAGGSGKNGSWYARSNRRRHRFARVVEW